jgi:hypothetical protein
MIDTDRFAQEWVAAWNARDLDAVLAHYREDFEMSSPFIAQIAGVASGVLKGKPAIRAYWSAALARMPALHFDLIATMAGVNSAVIHYRGPGGRLCAEVFAFDPDGLVHRAAAHYTAAA